MQQKNLIATVIVALVAMCAPVIGLIPDDSEATTSAHGVYSVYAYNGTAWSTDLVTDAYDAAQAVQKSDMWQSTTDSMTPLYVQGTYVTYQPELYGGITTFMGLSNTTSNVWNVFVYVNGNWISPTPSLGCYVCFDDIQASYRSANVCLYYGTAMTSAPTNIPTQTQALSPVISVGETSDYEYRIYVKVSSSYNVAISTDVYDEDGDIIDETMLHNGVFVKAYGSNAAVAVNNLFGANISIVTAIPGIYNDSYYLYQGWINSFFGLTTQQTAGADTPNDWTDNTYVYWNLYDRYNVFTGEADHLSDFVLGAFSTMSCAPIADSTFALLYQ